MNLLSFKDMCLFIDTIEKLPIGLAFTQRSYRFTASIKENLLLLDTTDMLRLAGAAYNVKDPNRLWHERIGHLAEGSLEQLRKVADGIEDVHPDEVRLCKDCVKGRMREHPHDGSILPGTYLMEAVHIDIAELPLAGFDGSKYVVTILDDHTEWAELTPVKHKSEYFESVRYFVEHNKTPTRQCKRIRLDRAGENQAIALESGLPLEELNSSTQTPSSTRPIEEPRD